LIETERHEASFIQLVLYFHYNSKIQPCLLDNFHFVEDITAWEEEFFEALEFIRSLNVVNGEYFINDQISAGKKGAEVLGYPMELREGTLMDFPLEKAGIVCAFDILHYLPVDQQENLIRRLADAARSGSLVLVRNGVRDCGWRSGMTLLEEWWTRATGWIKGGRMNFPRLNHLIEVFESEGCLVEAKPLWGKTPFSSYWLKISSRH
jgi:hypothetical protein